MNSGNLVRTFKCLARESGVTEIRLHDLRHTHASLLALRGVSPKVIADRSGHTNVGFTMQVYTHVFEEQRIVAYLIAITPDLQTSAQEKRQQRTRVPAASSVDAKQLFGATCSQCHPGKLIEAHNFKAEPSEALVQRMVANGMKASEADLTTITAYLTQTYGR